MCQSTSSDDTTLGEAGFRPYLPFTLLNQQVSVRASALLDTGASVNVLPYLGSCQVLVIQDCWEVIQVLEAASNSTSTVDS